MKKFYLAIFHLLFIQFANALEIQQIIVSAINGEDLNVYVKVQEGYTFSFSNHFYTVENNVITLTACYHPHFGSAITTRENNFVLANLNSLQGNYQLIVNTWFTISDGTNLICSDQNPSPDSETLFFTTALIEPIALSIFQDEFLAYGLQFINPCNGWFEFESNNENIFTILIYDGSGRKVKGGKISRRDSIDFNELENGIYYIQFQFQEAVLTKALIINKT